MVKWGSESVVRVGRNWSWGVTSQDWSSSDGWCLSVDNSVEAVDAIGGVSDNAEGAVGLNERVLSGHCVSVSGFGVGLGVSGEGILDRVSKVVLWVVVVRLSGKSCKIRDTAVDINSSIGQSGK